MPMPQRPLDLAAQRGVHFDEPLRPTSAAPGVAILEIAIVA
jgi:hypothetical protein